MTCERCNHPDCDRVRAPGAEFCCGACQLATAVGYSVPDTPSLGHTDMCDRRQLVEARPLASG